MHKGPKRCRLTSRATLIAATASLSLLIGACGSSTGTDDASSGDANSSGPGGSSGFQLDEPVTIGQLWEIKGESPYGVDALNQGAMLAVEEINAAGGVGGKPIEVFRLPASPVDLQQTVSAMVDAQSREPTAIVGLVAPSQVAAVSRTIERSPIPVIATSASGPDYVFGSDAGHDNLWTTGVYDPRLASSAVDFLVNDMGFQKIGLMGTNEAYGNGGIEVATAQLKKLGLEPFAVAQYAPDASDLTQQVLQMEGADAVINWGYPNPLAVALKQFRQNGLDIPTMASTSGLTLLGQGITSPEDTENLYLAVPCDTLAPEYSENLAGFTERFKEKYGADASVGGPIGPWAYDAIKAVAAAVNLAESTDPEKVNAALAEIEVPDGSGCGGLIQPDAGHVFTHEVVISKVSADGTSEVVKIVDTDPVEAAN